jgi:hypothetical protein
VSHPRTRAERRHHFFRKRDKIEYMLRHIWWFDPGDFRSPEDGADWLYSNIRFMAITPKPCSCMGCTHPDGDADLPASFLRRVSSAEDSRLEAAS